MYPIFLQVGSLHIYSVSVCMIVAWLVFSFLFWRIIRAHGIHEDVIFDITFYASLAAFVAARVGYITLHWEVFAHKSMLLMAALWVAPGLSWLAGLVGGLATIVYVCRHRKIRLGHVLDALPTALGFPIIFGELGSLFDGAEVGSLTKFPWGIVVDGHTGARHPVQVYEIMAMVVIIIMMSRLTRVARKRSWAYGVLGMSFITLYSFCMFGLEFFKVSRVYWGNITANQWVYIILFAESIGVLYVRGGGREHMRPFFRSLGNGVELKVKKIYAKISHRPTPSN